MQNNLNNLTIGAFAKVVYLPVVNRVRVIAMSLVISVPRLRRGSYYRDRRDCLRQHPVP